MKKLLLLLVFFVGLTTTAMAQNGEDDLVKTAKRAARECIQNAKEPGYEIIGFSEVVSACYAEGFVHKVTLYKVPKHIPDNVRIIPELVAEVTIGCAGEVNDVLCGF